MFKDINSLSVPQIQSSEHVNVSQREEIKPLNSTTSNERNSCEVITLSSSAANIV